MNPELLVSLIKRNSNDRFKFLAKWKFNPLGKLGKLKVKLFKAKEFDCRRFEVLVPLNSKLTIPNGALLSNLPFFMALDSSRSLKTSLKTLCRLRLEIESTIFRITRALETMPNLRRLTIYYYCSEKESNWENYIEERRFSLLFKHRLSKVINALAFEPGNKMRQNVFWEDLYSNQILANVTRASFPKSIFSGSSSSFRTKFPRYGNIKKLSFSQALNSTMIFPFLHFLFSWELLSNEVQSDRLFLCACRALLVF